MKRFILLLISIFLISCENDEEIIIGTPIVIEYTDYQKEVLDEINLLRNEYNCTNLIPEKILTECATSHAEYMDSINAINHDFFYKRVIISKAKRFGEVCVKLVLLKIVNIIKTL